MFKRQLATVARNTVTTWFTLISQLAGESDGLVVGRNLGPRVWNSQALFVANISVGL